jgi:nucleotide-binding universal stress UspA family protein
MTAVGMENQEFSARAIQLPRVKARPIVVATDGSDGALLAFNAASLIRRESGRSVDVISVLERMPLIPTPDGVMLPPDFDDSREEAQRRIVGAQIRKFDPSNEWRMDVRFGRPADVIVRFARERNAELIIIASNHHGFIGRVLGEETAMEIVRLTDIPLLVASSGMERSPERVIIGLDLDPTGLENVTRALEPLSGKKSVSFVHVKPRSEFMGVDWAQYDSEYDLAVRERFAEVQNSFNSAGMQPDLIVLHGEIGHELVDFASYSKAELIILGVRRRRGRNRAIGGRLAGRVLRQASCSVLIVPGGYAVDEAAVETPAATVVSQDSRQWSAILRDFTARNSGRVSRLEVADPAIGAMVEAVAYPLLGVDYDHKDNRLMVTLGSTKGVERHLSHSVISPQSVSVLSENGRDSALSVSHGGGQTLLTF